MVFTLLTGMLSCSTSVNLEVEKEAIKAVIEEEKDGYLARDLERIRNTWTQDTASRKFCFSEKGMTYLNGWEMIDNDHITCSESEMWDNVEDLSVVFSDYEFNIYGNTALVFLKSSWSGISYGRELNTVQKRILHLVKADGVWKLDLMAIIAVTDENEQ